MKKKIIMTLGIAAAVLGAAAVYRIYGQTFSRIADRETPKTVSVTVWIHSKALSELIGNFERKHTGVNAEVRTFRSYDQLYEELMAAISANMAPDLAEIDSRYGLVQLAETQALLPVDEAIGPDGMSSFHPAFASPFVYKGKTWAIPYGGSVPVLYYNQSLLKLAGISFPPDVRSWGDVMEIGKNVTRDVDGNGTPDYWGLLVDKDVPWFFRNMTVEIRDKKAAPAALQDLFRLWRRLIFEAGIMPPLRHHFAASDFINGRAGFFLASSDKLPTLQTYIGGKFAYDLLPMPGRPGHEPVPNASGFVLLRTDGEKQNAAIRLIRYLVEPDVQEQLPRTAAKLPSRLDAMARVQANDPASEHGFGSLAKSMASVPPSADDLAQWRAFLSILESLEAKPEVSVETITEQVMRLTR